MSVALLAQRSFAYAGKTVRTGQTFLAQSDHDATVLTLAGHAIVASGAVADVEQPPAVAVTPTKRTYRRRQVKPDAD